MKAQEIDELLKASAHEPALPANFRSEVWNRIAHAEQRSFASKLRRVLALFTRPVPAVASAVVMALLGGSLGITAAPTRENPKMSYAESISPFLQDKAP